MYLGLLIDECSDHVFFVPKFGHFTVNLGCLRLTALNHDTPKHLPAIIYVGNHANVGDVRYTVTRLADTLDITRIRVFCVTMRSHSPPCH